MSKIEKIAVAGTEPRFIGDIDVGLAATLRTLQAEGKLVGIEASLFVAGFKPLESGHALVYFSHLRDTFADRGFVIRTNQLNPGGRLNSVSN